MAARLDRPLPLGPVQQGYESAAPPVISVATRQPAPARRHDLQATERVALRAIRAIARRTAGGKYSALGRCRRSGRSDDSWLSVLAASSRGRARSACRLGCAPNRVGLVVTCVGWLQSGWRTAGADGANRPGPRNVVSAGQPRGPGARHGRQCLGGLWARCSAAWVSQRAPVQSRQGPLCRSTVTLSADTGRSRNSLAVHPSD